MDENREKRKRLRAVLSFVTMAVLLVVLFFAAINIGSLKVSFGTLMRGLLWNGSTRLLPSMTFVFRELLFPCWQEQP